MNQFEIWSEVNQLDSQCVLATAWYGWLTHLQPSLPHQGLLFLLRRVRVVQVRQEPAPQLVSRLLGKIPTPLSLLVVCVQRAELGRVRRDVLVVPDAAQRERLHAVRVAIVGKRCCAIDQ